MASTFSKTDLLHHQPNLKEFNIEFFESIDSTSSYAKRYVESNQAVLPSIFATTKQTAAYGKESRTFFSPKGLYVTLVLPITNLKELNPGLLTISAGLGVLDTLTDYFPHQFFQLKWVNDILLNHKKCGGILTELIQDQSQRYYLVLGIGLNLQTPTLPDELWSIATTIDMVTNANYSILLADLVANTLHRLTNQTSPHLIVEYKHHSNLLGHKITVKGHQKAHTGFVRDFDKLGGLILENESDNQLLTFYSGDVIKILY